jgi:hypothetical protein
MGLKVKGVARRKVVKLCRRNAGALIDVVEPFVAHATAGVLSGAMRMCGCCVAVLLVARMVVISKAMSSRSLFVNEPWGF